MLLFKCLAKASHPMNKCHWFVSLYESTNEEQGVKIILLESWIYQSISADSAITLMAKTLLLLKVV